MKRAAPLSLRLPQPLLESLKAAANRDGTTINAFIRRALEQVVLPVGDTATEVVVPSPATDTAVDEEETFANL